MAKGDLHISRGFVHSDLNLTESDVKVITNNRIESPFRSMRDSHSVSSFTPDKGDTGVYCNEEHLGFNRPDFFNSLAHSADCLYQGATGRSGRSLRTGTAAEPVNDSSAAVGHLDEARVLLILAITEQHTALLSDLRYMGCDVVQIARKRLDRGSELLASIGELRRLQGQDGRRTRIARTPLVDFLD